MEKTVEWYLAHGFDPQMAEYFAAGRRKITAVTPNPDFTLTLHFDHGEKRLLDCKPFLERGTVFEPFTRYEHFRRVYLDELHRVCWDINPNINSDEVWSNKVDIDPDRCYVDSVPLDPAEAEIARGETVPDSAIDWDAP